MMNVHPQIIIKNNSPEFVVLPYKEYGALLDILEEVEDIKAVQEFHEEEQETIPFTLLKAISDGNSPVRVFREFRNLSQAALAKEVGISRQYLCQIEKKERHGSSKILKSIASVLRIDLELLID